MRESFAGFAMTCGHPLAARRIIRDDSIVVGIADLPIGLKTDCWACAVQREVVSKIVGPRAAKHRDVAV